MNNKLVNQALLTVIFIILLPLITIESIIIRPNNFVGQIVLNFQILLFIVALGCQE